MKKIILILFFLFFIPGICLSEWSDNKIALDPGGYRNAKWGMTKQEVKKAIPDEKWQDDWFNKLFYSTKIDKSDATANFIFDNGKLVKVTIYVLWSDFNSIARILISKYEEPDDKSTTNPITYTTKDPFFSTFKSQTIQGLVYIWVFPTTSIVLEEREHSIGIHYMPKPKKVEEKEKEKL